MARTIITREGDVVDQIALAAYGVTAEATETVLAANAILSGYGPVLPEGLVLTLPVIDPVTTATVVKLWD
jgi:phage tail protein X